MARGMSRCASTISSVTKLRKFLSQGLHDALDDEGNGDVDGAVTNITILYYICLPSLLCISQT